MKIVKVLSLITFLLLIGCSSQSKISPESITPLREYDLDGIHTVVGVGKWNPNGSFHIKSYDGQEWDADSSVVIKEGPVTLGSFERARKSIAE